MINENRGTSYSRLHSDFRVDREAHAQEDERSHALFRVRFRFTSYYFRHMVLYRQRRLQDHNWQFKRFSWIFNESNSNNNNVVRYTLQTQGERNRSTGKSRDQTLELWEVGIQVPLRARFRSDSLFTRS